MRFIGFALVLLALATVQHPSPAAAADSCPLIKSARGTFSARPAYRAARKRVRRSTFAADCKSISTIGRGHALVKNAWPGHISRLDPRSSGFALVCGSLCANFPAVAYYSDGEQAFKLGYYGRWSGNGKPRAYCAAGGAPRCSATKVKKQAKAGDRDGFVYVARGGGKCWKITPGIRNGDV